MSKVFVLEHCSDNPSIVPATESQTASIAASRKEPSDVTAFVEYWEEYHPEEGAEVLEFLNTNTITECGTIESLSLDYFIVDPNP